MTENRLCQYGGTACEPATHLVFDRFDQEWVEACAACAQDLVEQERWETKPIGPEGAR
jgi:hypothetical protein